MKKRLFVLGFFAHIFCSAQVYLKLSEDTLRAYTYSGGDEFNAPMLDEVAWKNGLGGRRVLMTQDLAFSPKNVEQKDGVINFIANKQDSNYVLFSSEVDSVFLKKEKMQLKDNRFMTRYSAGGIISRKKYHYGLYELRFKVEEGRGVWPAFWFYGGNKNEEIDVFELKCERNDQIHVDTHCPYGCDKGYRNNLGIKTNWGGWMPVSTFLHEGFNIMALEWKENELIWYINGFPLAYFEGTFPNPMSLFINTSVAKDGGAFKPGPDNTTLWPNTYSVDYLRIWQPLKPADDVIIKVSEHFAFPAEESTNNRAVPEKKSGYIYKKKKVKKIEGTITLSLSAQRRLCINVLGKLKKESSVIIKTRSTEQTFDDFQKEITLDLDKSETSFLVLVNTAGKQYSQEIKIQD